MLDIIYKGGYVMYPLILCSLVALAIFIERLIFYKRLGRASRPIVEALLRHNETRRNPGAAAFRMPAGAFGPVVEILEAVRPHASDGKEAMRDVATETANREIHHLEKRLGILSTIVYVAPLMGLLGTVTGMIAAFRRIETLSIEGKPIGPGELAAGIWEALITTAAGLVIAIPAFIAYNYLVSLKQELVSDTEMAVTEIIGILSQGR